MDKRGEGGTAARGDADSRKPLAQATAFYQKGKLIITLGRALRTYSPVCSRRVSSEPVTSVYTIGNEQCKPSLHIFVRDESPPVFP